MPVNAAEMLVKSSQKRQALPDQLRGFALLVMSY